MKFTEALRKGRQDPVLFSEYFCGITPHPGQVKWLTSGLQTKERTLAAGNRYGKSKVAAIRRLWKSFYKIRDKQFNYLSDYVSVCLSITMDQAKIVWKECEQILLNRPQLTWTLRTQPIHKPYPIIRLSNGAEIWARSTDQPKNLWGHRFDDVNFDEPAMEKKPEETLPLIRTRLMDTNGQLDFTGTPWGRNWYYKQFLKAQDFPNDFYSQKGKTDENPHTSGDARARLLKEEFMTDKQRLQNLEGEFVSFDEGVFEQADIEYMFSDPSIAFLEERIPAHFYIDGWDIAFKRDAMAGITIDVSTIPIKIVAFERYQKVPWDFIYAKIRERHQRFNSLVILDTTGLGQHMPQELEDVDPIGVIIGAKEGPIMKSKTGLILNLQKYLQKRHLKSPFIPKLLEELTFYEWDDKNLSTDCVIALALALYYVELGIPQVSAVGAGIVGNESVSSYMNRKIKARLR